MARLEAGRAAAVLAQESGPPCEQCLCFIKEGALCAAPANSDHKINHVTGALVQVVEVPADQARRADGLCGPEALLFEKRSGAALRRATEVISEQAPGAYVGFAFGMIFWALLIFGI